MLMCLHLKTILKQTQWQTNDKRSFSTDINMLFLTLIPIMTRKTTAVYIYTHYRAQYSHQCISSAPPPLSTAINDSFPRLMEKLFKCTLKAFSLLNSSLPSRNMLFPSYVM